MKNPLEVIACIEQFIVKTKRKQRQTNIIAVLHSFPVPENENEIR